MASSSYYLSCTPEPCWKVRGETVPDELAAIGKGTDEGKSLLILIGKEKISGNDPGLLWLADIVRTWLKKLALIRNLPDSNPWADDDGRALLASLPAMPGGEYADEALMAKTASGLWKTVKSEIEICPGGIDGWFACLGEAWSLVGKVILHLAELPAAGERPFGFLATYAETISTEGRVQHLPLARALAKFKTEGRSMEILLNPLRKAAMNSLWLKSAMETGMLFRAESLSIEDAYTFLKAVPELNEAGLVTRMPANWKAGPPSRVVVQVSLGESGRTPAGGRPLWDFRADLALDGETLTEEEWEKIRQSGAGLVSLRGKWVEVDAEHVQTLLSSWRKLGHLHRQGIPLSTAMRLLAGTLPETIQAQSSEAKDAGEWSIVKAGESLERCLSALGEYHDLPVDKDLKAELRPYQSEGVSWMRSLYMAGMGGCLADDMGLGKTVQVIAFLSLLKKEKGSDHLPSLIVAPASLLSNWHSELHRFAPHLSCAVYHASSQDADSCDFSRCDLVLTTYSYLHRRSEIFENVWDTVVMDEAQNVKNPDTLQSRAAYELKANMKLALTGTPVENGLGDLWSIMNIVNPGLLGSSLNSFIKGMEATGKHNAYPVLKKLISPFILRRMKSDGNVALHLPPKTELVQRCYLTRRQAVLYAHLTESLKRELYSNREVSDNEEAAGKGRGSPILKYILKFKQLCDHPSLLNGDNVFSPEEGGKFARLGELAREWSSRQERILVFTQFREMCVPLARYLEGIFGKPGLIMHGGTPLESRRAGVEEFQHPDGPPFYVLSVKTAGTGLTLTAATHVVHFDRWWNPAVENQASDRAYRLGQGKPVFIHKFLVQGTLEEKIDRLIHDKKITAENILQTDESVEKLLFKMNKEELLAFFRAVPV